MGNSPSYPAARTSLATRFRIPDITVLVVPFVDEETITHPPFLCIEILSKDDTMNRIQERSDDYLRFGVSYVWTIDPRTHRCFVQTVSDAREATNGSLTTANPELTLPLNEIFD